MFRGLNFALKRPRCFVGVDIGSSSLRAVEITCQGNNIKSLKYGCIESPPGIDSGSFMPEQLAGLLSKLFFTCSIGQTRVNVSMGGNRLITKCLTLPEMPARELGQALNWEAEKYLPQGEYIIRHVVLQVIEADGIRKSVVMLAAAPRELVNLYYSTFTGAGLAINSIDIPFLALWRVFARAGTLGKGNICVVEVGTGMARLVFCQGRSINFIRIISLSGRGFTAEKDSLGELAKQLTRSLEYIHSQGRVTGVEKIIICGSAQGLDAMAVRLGRELGHLVEAGVPNFLSLPPDYVVAAGLALGGW